MRILIAAYAFVTVSLSLYAQEAPGFLAVKGRAFVDSDGRQVLLHGMNVVNKNKAENYQSWQGAQQFADMHNWGMNCVRLGIIWDGLEPEPGKYDEEYLKGVDQRIAWAKEAGLYVFLDMHQDLFSVLYSDGAPEWATLTDGKPHLAFGEVWSDAYNTSPAVQAAFDSFWANKPCADGVGVQDHYARAWRHVAARYKDDPTVIGYDLMNEPNAGSANLEVQMRMVGAFAEAIAKKEGAGPTAEEVALQWLTQDGRAKLMEKLRDLDIYKPVVDAAQDIFADFERTKLMPMFQRVTNAIREVDPNHIILLETSMSANMGIPTAIEPVLGPDGKRDPLQAYAPHGYDIVVDTPDNALASPERVALIFNRHLDAAKRLDMPMIVGEWGAYGGAGEAIVPAAQHVARLFEQLLAGDTYWEFGRYVYDAAYLPALQRPIPLRVAGELTRYSHNPDTRAFECVWQESAAIAAPTIVYVPGYLHKGRDSVELSPAGGAFEVEETRPDSGNVHLHIKPTGQGGERKLTVR